MTKAEEKIASGRTQTYAMARYICRRHVETEIRRRGDKLSHYSAKDIYELADEYFRSHKDEVMRKVMVWQVESELLQLSKVLHRKRKAEIKAKSLCITRAQNGAQK